MLENVINEINSVPGMSNVLVFGAICVVIAYTVIIIDDKQSRDKEEA